MAGAALTWLAACAEPTDADGWVLGPAWRPREGGADQHHATVALDADGRGLVAFVAGDDVVVAPARDGRQTAPASRPLAGPAHHPQVVGAGAGALLVATRAGVDGLAHAALGWDGGAAGEGHLAPGERARHPDLALAGGGGLLAWAGDDGVALAAFGGSLAAATRLAPLPLAGLGVGTPAVRARPGGWAVTWAERDPGRSAVHLALLDGGGALAGEVSALDAWPTFDDDARPGLAVGPDGELVVAWRRESERSAWLSFRDAAGDEVTRVELPDAGRPAVAAAGDRALVGWEQWEDGRWTVVLGEFALATGEVLGPWVTVAETVAPARPAVAAAGGAALVSWEDGREGGRAVWVRGLAW